MQGAQILRNEAYFLVRRSDEGCSATPHMGSLHSRQCLKCLTPVNTIAILYSSIALITSSSFIEPPGWIIAVIPTLAASSIASLNGKKASEAMTHPLILLRDLDTASFTESTRLI